MKVKQDIFKGYLKREKSLFKEYKTSINTYFYILNYNHKTLEYKKLNNSDNWKIYNFDRIAQICKNLHKKEINKFDLKYGFSLKINDKITRFYCSSFDDQNN